MQKSPYWLIIYLLLRANLASSSVPAPYTKIPTTPFFMEPYRLRTIEQTIFSPEVDGMVSNRWGNLNWNPAYLASQTRKALYIDFNFVSPTTESTIVLPIYYPYQVASHNVDYIVTPRWFTTTTTQTVNTEPLYNLALILPVSAKTSIGIANRTLFDYGPYRTATWWENYGWRDANAYKVDSNIPSLSPARLEVDENQQTVIGNQLEFNLGHQYTSQQEVGIHLGGFIFRRFGHLYDSKYGYYPHYSFANLNKEKMSIKAYHLDAGFGTIVHPNERHSFGVMVGYIFGNSSEVQSSRDTAKTWAENELNPTYYYLNQYDLSSRDHHSDDGKSPYVKLIYSYQISPKLVLNSRLAFSSVNHSYRTTSNALDAGNSDYVYKTWSWTDSLFHNQRQQSENSRTYELTGSGKDKGQVGQFLLSLTYQTENDWEFFSGFSCTYNYYTKDIHEDDNLITGNFLEYSLYDPRTIRWLKSHQKRYTYHYTHTDWKVICPLGVKLAASPQVRLILGSELQLTLNEEKSSGENRYAEVIAKRWDNGYLTQDDEETNRWENFSDKPPRTFDRKTTVRVGVALQHKSGVTLFIRSGSELFTTTGWALGFNIEW